MCRGCVGGACRVCRVCQGCVGGVCARLDGSSAPRGPRLPPPDAGPQLPLFSPCVLDAGCAPAAPGRLSPGTSSFSASGRRRPSPPGVALRVPRDSRCRPLGTSSSGISPGIQRHARQTGDCFLFFPGDSQRDARHTRVWVSPCTPHGAFIRRPPRPPSPPHRNANSLPNSQISPPREKHPPDPRGPSTRPGMDAGRPPRCVRARQAST